jgi:hypothetical protein
MRHAARRVAPAVPRTLTGKNLEVPIKRILQGAPAGQVTSSCAITDHAALDWYARYRRTITERMSAQRGSPAAGKWRPGKPVSRCRPR